MEWSKQAEVIYNLTWNVMMVGIPVNISKMDQFGCSYIF